MMLMWIPLVVLIVLLLSDIRPRYGSHAHSSERPEEVLRMRLARGEISAEEFDRLVEKLHS